VIRLVSKRHKVFISYHHDEDQDYADKLRQYYGSSRAIIDKSMREDLGHLQPDTIMNKIRREHFTDSTVTVVLIGNHTWGRKWVDWEIGASIRPYMERTINGLVGIWLPDHSLNDFRLTDNLQSGYAVDLSWEDVEDDFIDKVHEAYNRRRRADLIDNTRSTRERNASLKPRKQPSGQATDCFIATAVYGTPYAWEVETLRRWRDVSLAQSSLGRLSIRMYNRVSPIIAEYIRERGLLKKMISNILDRLCRIIR
jgi:hypothetical protein